MRFNILVIFILTLSLSVKAQDTRYILAGKIVYEKRVNIHALINNEYRNSGLSNTAKIDELQKDQPQFELLSSNLQFNTSRSIFVPSVAKPETKSWYYNPVADQLNITYKNLDKNQQISQKSFFDEKFIVTDTQRSIKWKYTDETRMIAGFLCHRANGFVLDSIYAVAFYCKNIPASTGPESFGGLPGLILGIALPKEHVTWYAKTIVEDKVGDEEISLPQTGKPMDQQKFESYLQEILKGNKLKLQQYWKAFFL